MLVRKQIGPGRFVKIRQAPEDKRRRPAPPKAEAADFTEIDGIGTATAAQIRAVGIETWADLRAADLDTLPARARSAVEAWR